MSLALFFALSSLLALCGLWWVSPHDTPEILGTVVVIIAMSALYVAITE